MERVVLPHTMTFGPFCLRFQASQLRVVAKAVGSPKPYNPYKTINPMTPMSPRSPINPINPTSPKNPIEPPIEPVNPMNPLNPTEPINPMNPIIEPINPMNPIIEPINPLSPWLPQTRSAFAGDLSSLNATLEACRSLPCKKGIVNLKPLSPKP